MDSRISWYRTPISRAELRALTQRSDRKGLAQAGSFLLVYVALAAAALYFSLDRRWGLMIAACYAHAVFSSFVGMEAAVHELSHGTPFRTKWLNEFFYRLFSFLTWNNCVHFRASHAKHHQYTLHNGLDKEVIVEPDPFTVWDYISWFTFDYKKFKKIMFPNIAHLFGKADSDVFYWDPLFSKGDPRRNEMVAWARFMVIGHAILIAVFIYFELYVLIFIVSMSYFFATFFGHATGMQQHLGLRSNVPDWRVICHSVRFGKLPAYLYWQMNYHTEHHMYAAVPFHNVPRLHRVLAHDVPQSADSFIGGVKRILDIHRRQRAEPSYRFMPAFPETATPPVDVGN